VEKLSRLKLQTSQHFLLTIPCFHLAGELSYRSQN
jgi:hypothetical protein